MGDDCEQHLNGRQPRWTSRSWSERIKLSWVKPRRPEKRSWFSVLDTFTGNPAFPGDILLAKSGQIAFVPVAKHGSDSMEFHLEMSRMHKKYEPCMQLGCNFGS